MNLKKRQAGHIGWDGPGSDEAPLLPIRKWAREIRKVGLRDWLWFVVWLRRNEFSPKLDILRYHPDRMDRLLHDRNRAHRLDHEIGA